MTPSQLCQLAGTWAGRDPPLHAIVEEKRDGFRALWLRDHTGKPGLYTRGGYPIHGVAHIERELLAIEREAGEPLFLDGEFQVNGNLADTKRWCESGWKAGGEAGELFLFDCLPQARWTRGSDETPLRLRKARLCALWASVAEKRANQWEWEPGSRGRCQGPLPVSVLPHSRVFSAFGIVEAVQEVWQRGGEGCMVKDADAPYQRNRSNAWLKVKRDQSWTKQWRIAA